MSLFDYVRCEVPLPDGYEGELQTKDFDDPYMLTHIITREGRLLREVLLRVEVLPKSERPYPAATDDDWRSLCGSLKPITSVCDSKFHGLFRFYGQGHDYIAKFTDGQLVNILQDDAG